MATTLEVLGLRVDLDTKDAKRDMDRLQGAISKRLKGLDQSAKDFNKGLGKMVHQYTVVRRTAVPMLKDVEKSYGRLQRSVTDVNSELDRWRKKLTTSSAEERVEIEKEIKIWEKLRDSREKALSSMERTKEDLETRIVFDRDEFVEALKDAGRELYEPIDRLLSKDFPGAFESGGKLLGKAVEKTFKGGSLLAKAGGKFGQEAGERMLSRGKMSMARGGFFGKLGGAAQIAGGGALQGIGKLASGLAPVLNIISKLGPILSTMSTLLVGIVKLFVDAEAAAKEFNKEILSTAGSAAFLHNNFNRVDMGVADLGNTLKQIRDQATSLENMNWGINKDTHKAVLSSLTAEGVSLQRLQDDFDATAKSSKEAAGFAKSFGSTVQMAVAFSRNLGVSLQDITSLQSEMMTDMGMGLKSVELSFAQMSRAAADGGIASNKFFGIIRGVSADLSLYNTRMEETVKILGLLGKVMSPRNAQKFMQTATQALKGMSKVDRLKTNLLGGGNMGKLVEKDLDRKSKDIASKIAEAGGKAGLSREDLMTKSMSDLMQGVGQEQQGTLREAISEMRMDAKANRKGVFGQSVAGRNLGPGAALQAIKSSLNITGTGKLRDRRGDLGTEMLAEAVGIGEDQLAQMAKFEEAIDEQREDLKSDLKAGGERQAKAMKKLEKAGLKAEDIDSAGYDDILATLDKEQQEALKDAGKQIDYAKETSKFQSSLLDKIENIAEFIMNQVYNVLSGIWDTLVDSSIFGNEGKRKERDLAKIAKSAKDSDLNKALSDAEGDIYKFRASLMGSGGMQKLLGAAKGNQAVQSKMLEGANGVERQNAIEDALGKDIGKSLATRFEHLKYGGEDKYKGVMAEYERLKKEKGLDAADEYVRSQKREDLKYGSQMYDPSVLQELLSPEEMEQVLGKLGWHLDPLKLAKSFPELKDLAGVGSAQAAASERAEPTPPSPEKAEPTTPAPGQPTAPVTPSAAALERPALPKDAPTSDQQQKMISTLDDTHDALRRQGIVIDKSFLKSSVGRQVEDSTLEALRQALYEYYLYKDIKQADMMTAIQGGMSPRKIGSALADKLAEGVTSDKAISELTANASGGVVTSVEGGVAKVRPAAGEGLASIGKGEKIVPAGGGGGKVVVELVMNGDLKRLIRAEASNAIFEHEGARSKR